MSLASKPASPRKCPVLGSRTALFFDLMKMDQGMIICFTCLGVCQMLHRKILKIFLFLMLEKFCNFFDQRPLNFFFFRRTLARCVLGSWPWTFLSLAGRRSDHGRSVRDLGLGFLFVSLVLLVLASSLDSSTTPLLFNKPLPCTKLKLLSLDFFSVIRF